MWIIMQYHLQSSQCTDMEYRFIQRNKIEITIENRPYDTTATISSNKMSNNTRIVVS